MQSTVAGASMGAPTRGGGVGWGEVVEALGEGLEGPWGGEGVVRGECG